MNLNLLNHNVTIFSDTWISQEIVELLTFFSRLSITQNFHSLKEVEEKSREILVGNLRMLIVKSWKAYKGWRLKKVE